MANNVEEDIALSLRIDVYELRCKLLIIYVELGSALRTGLHAWLNLS